MTDSSKTDTLNSSSSSTTASSIDKSKVRANAPLINPPAHPATVLTVLRKPNPPPPPPRLTPVKFEETQRLINSTNTLKNNPVSLRNGGFPGGPVKLPNGDVCAIHNIKVDKMTGQSLTHRTEKDRCSQATTRERVRFSENVLYHGYCPDCDVRSEMKNRDVHLHGEPVHLATKLPHHCPLPPPPKPPYPVENGGLGINSGVCQPPLKPGSQPPPIAPKPQKTILRKSTTTTV
ncbi:protein Largen isoform X2 [Hyperolius riggenbachi]